MTPRRGAPAAALVTDAYWRKTVAVVRSLGRAGARVDAADSRALAPAGFSRHCRRRLRSPDPRIDPPGFLRWARDEALREGYSLLLAGELATCRVLATGKSELPAGTWVPVPPPAQLDEAADKLTALERAARAGIPVPETASFGPGDRAPRRGSWILKPRQGTGAYGIRRLGPGDPAPEDDLQGRFGPLLLQEFVPGRRNGFGVSLLYGPDGRWRAGFVHRKIRELPVSGGVSTCAESVVRPDLVALARRYVEGGEGVGAIPWEGVVNFEFKVHAATGRPHLIEVNPRLWGSLPLAIAAGVDFPTLLWRLARGEDPPAPAYRAGVRLRWVVYGELAHGWQRLRRGEIPWDVLGEEARGDFLWDRDDPMPLWACLAAWGLAIASPAERARLRR